MLLYRLEFYPFCKHIEQPRTDWLKIKFMPQPHKPKY